MVDEATVRRLALRYPETREGSSHGTLAFYARKKLFVWFNKHGQLAVRMGVNEREMLVHAEPEKFFYTDHYRDYPAVLIHQDAIDEAELADLIDSAWRLAAPPTLVRRHEEATVVR
jgi:hypothetical protein